MSVFYRSLTCISVWSLDIAGLVLVLNMHELFAAGRFIQPSIKSVLNMILMSYKFEDTKVVIRSHKSNKDRQHNDQRKRGKGHNNLQSTTQKTKDWAFQTPLKSVGELRCSRRVSSSCYTSGTRPLCSCYTT